MIVETKNEITDLSEGKLEQVAGGFGRVSQTDVVHTYMNRLWEKTDDRKIATQSINLHIDSHKHEGFD